MIHWVIEHGDLTLLELEGGEGEREVVKREIERRADNEDLKRRW